MGLVDHGILFISTFFNVFLLGFNSKNVHQSRYLLAFVTSWGITVAGYFFVKYAVAGDGFLFIGVSGVGGSLGIIAAIYVHDNFADVSLWDMFKRKPKFELKIVEPKHELRIVDD
ncbi:MAG: hypothetical protein HRT93_03150 [Piscirickettsiaceae bacterium]|nr:hypothetical protein [Piscirickettsiaceae bacterium]